MPKVKWGIDPDEPEELEQFDVYDGPDLKSGVYEGVLTRLTVKKNKNDDDMLNGLFVVKDDTKPQYNGAAVWFNQNVTDQGKPYLLLFLKAIGLAWKDFTSRSVLEDSKERPTKVLKIGNIKFNDGEEVPVRVQIGMSRTSPEYPESKPEIKQFLKPRAAEWDDSDDEDDGDEERPF